MRKRITRAKLLEFFAALSPCLVGIEACPTAHHWSRQLQALGHTVRLLPPSYVKAYLKRSKNDANDAAAICEAVTRPSMRFVTTKSEQQQSGAVLTTSGATTRHAATTANPARRRKEGVGTSFSRRGPNVTSSSSAPRPSRPSGEWDAVDVVPKARGGDRAGRYGQCDRRGDHE
jgi:hypothetical protein